MDVQLDARRRALRQSIPPWYNGYVHFASINLVCALAIAWLASRLCEPTRGELWMAPVFFAFANLVEWIVHRGPMHHPRRWLMPLYRRHALEHHVLFTADRMEFRNHRDLKFVLFPPLFFPFLLLLTAPLCLALWAYSPNVALVYLISAHAYYLVYEWFHTVHHWPRNSRLGRSWFARLVREHHRRHHDLRGMTRGNFNVSFPLWDHLFGTVLTE